jgi:hypothetical protein
VIYYAILLGTAILVGPSRFVFGGILLAAGVHGVLLSVLIARSILCPPCILTGTAAIASMVMSFFLERQNLVRASVLLPAAAVGSHFLLFGLGMIPRVGERAAEAERQAALGELRAHPREPGRVLMVIYTRPDCGYCRELDHEVLPGIEAEFGSKLTIEHRSALEIPGMPTPTILLAGPGGERAFPGLPATERLRAAIQVTMGGDHERQALVPTSR